MPLEISPPAAPEMAYMNVAGESIILNLRLRLAFPVMHPLVLATAALKALERAVHFRSVCNIYRGYKYTWSLFSLVGSRAS